ncbi:MAG: hypothetical protein M9901_10110 [Lentimicrobium sp.]|nr:hypothetical protein [Lentimicrobium sp.]
MNDRDLQTFGILKQKIVERMLQSYPGINPSISEWKGQEIVDFQEELLQKVNARISEKWFYMHMKAANGGLPRIDILNILSRYAGYANWDDFRFKHAANSTRLHSLKHTNRYFYFVPVAALILSGLFFLLFKLLNTKEYRFTFYDADTGNAITNSLIKVSMLRDNESPVSYLCGPYGSFDVKTGRASLRFVVEAPCYHTDTIIRLLDKFNPRESVTLRPDNYALMIQYFSASRVTDWQKRRDQLNRIISDNAMIYQVYGKETLGVELYNKGEFINKLTLPSASLQGIEIFDTRYEAGKISLIRFRQKEVKP